MIRSLLVVLALTTTLAATDAEPSDPLKLWNEGETALEAGDAATAAEKFRAAGLLLSGNPLPSLYTAKALIQLGRIDEANEQLMQSTAMGVVVDPIMIALPAGAPTPWKAASEANAKPISASTIAFTIPERSLIPESIAYDATDGSFYAGSMYRRKIVRVDASGHVTDFIPSKRDGLWQVIGIKIDPRRRELWANACDTKGYPPMIDPEPGTVMKGGVFRYDLRDGRLIGKYDVSNEKESLCFNDLVFVGPDVYLTTGPRGLYRIAAGTHVIEPFVDGFNDFVNGITASHDGKLLYVTGGRRGVFAVNIESRKIQRVGLPSDLTLAGIDGLYLHGNALIGIQSGLAPNVPRRVVRAELDANGLTVTHADVLERNHPLYDVPTTGVIIRNSLYYVANSQLRRFEAGVIASDATLHPTYILKLDLARASSGESSSAGDEASLLALHRDVLRAHLEGDVAGWMATESDDYVVASRGEISHPFKEARTKRVTAYLGQTHFTEYRDLVDPVVKVSDDGTLGWVIVQVKASGTQTVEGKSEPVEFVSAWVELYEKRDGRWLRTGNVSNFKP